MAGMLAGAGWFSQVDRLGEWGERHREPRALNPFTKGAPENVEEVPLRREAGAESHEQIT